MATSAEPIRIGLLGAARIARQAIIDPARTRDDVRIVAVAARDPERARSYAAKFGVAPPPTPKLKHRPRKARRKEKKS